MWQVFFVSCWHSHVFSWPEHNVLFCLDYLALLWTKRFNYLAPEKGLVLLMYQHRKQSESRILNDIPTLHSMAIDLTSCHDKPSHWLGMEVDSLWNHSEGDPCVDWVTNRMKKWAAVAACYIQSAMMQMKADRAGTVFQTAGFIQQPFFGVGFTTCLHLAHIAAGVFVLWA